ncbi:hypothetical protein [Cupriavidus sp. AcVe19-6a]|uniref:hypothetical protein n=1 Tax=Cupriavidus sp. AcVe19-6a TaxID=2821358 RepID=UPI001AE99A61|nr:hypothetical protein [Cupriavidus sp. AcVe19-6a]
MRISMQLVAHDEGGEPATITEIAQFERAGLDMGSLGLHLEEAKSLLGRLQRTMVAAQVVEAVARTSVCPTCGEQLACKGHHHLVFPSYGLTVNVLQEVLPPEHVLAASAIRRQVSSLGCRLEAEQATEVRQQAEVACRGQP